jgi:hypothetical protein
VSRLLILLVLYHHGYEVGRYISLERIVEQTKCDKKRGNRVLSGRVVPRECKQLAEVDFPDRRDVDALGGALEDLEFLSSGPTGPACAACRAQRPRDRARGP